MRQDQTIVLKIGELVFGRGKKRLQTLLGSCVAITLWHPQKKLSGMCHFSLPARGEAESDKELDPRYGDDSIALFKRLAEKNGTLLREFHARIYGGGNMLKFSKVKRVICQSDAEFSHVGRLNAAQAFCLLMQEQVKIIETNIGEQGYRKVDFDPVTGNAQCQFVSVIDADSPASKPKRVTKILVIDDSEITRHLLATSLKKEGYQVLVEINGAEGVRAFKADRPDLVLLDVDMPVMDGYECLQHLRQLAADVPVLMLTGNDDPNSMTIAFESGATDFINKPIRIPALKQRIFHALKQPGQSHARGRDPI